MKRFGLKTTKAKVIAALAASATLVGSGVLVLALQQSGRPEVRLTTATRGQLTSSVVAVGDVEAATRHAITLAPSVKVAEVLVQKGQRVGAGDLLAVLDTSDYANQLEQQGISRASAQSTLDYLAGPASTASNASAQNAVKLAQVALDNARADQSAAEHALADVPAFGQNAEDQAETSLEAARLNLDAAERGLASTETLGEDAVCQAEIAVDAAHDAREKAAHDLTALEDQLAAGLITQAQFDTQYPGLRYALDGAENAWASARVSLSTARTNADADVAAAEKAVEDAANAVTSAQAGVERASLTASSELRAAQQAVATAAGRVKGAELALANARNAATSALQSDSQRASAQRSQIDLIDSTVRNLLDKVDQGRLTAPVAGIVTRVDAVAGEYPQLGDAIVVDGTAGYRARMDVGQADSAGIKPGQRATVTLKDMTTTYEGTVSVIDPVAEKSATSADQHPRVGVQVSILDPDDTIRIGFEADVEIFLDVREDALQVGVQAVQRDPGTGRRYVWVVDDTLRISKVAISTGIETGDRVEVLSGLSEGQSCVIDPADSLVEGSMVRRAGGA